MGNEIKIIDINEEHISQYPPVCFLNPKNEGYLIKEEWAKKRFAEGLKIKQMYLENQKKAVGFIEYVPGEYAWRAVEARDYLFIHCIWITPNKNKNQGYASVLIDECIKDAREQDKTGVAAVASEGPFMTGKDLYIKNGFEIAETAKPSFSLLYKNVKDGPLPKFKDWQARLAEYEGLHIVYSNQCPWVARSIDELKDVASENNLEIKITEMETAKQAQNGPSIYSVFNIVYNGKLLVDHYISSTRFKNILTKELRK